MIRRLTFYRTVSLSTRIAQKIGRLRRSRKRQPGTPPLVGVLGYPKDVNANTAHQTSGGGAMGPWSLVGVVLAWGVRIAWERWKQARAGQTRASQ